MNCPGQPFQPQSPYDLLWLNPSMSARVVMTCDLRGGERADAGVSWTLVFRQRKQNSISQSAGSSDLTLAWGSDLPHELASGMAGTLF